MNPHDPDPEPPGTRRASNLSIAAQSLTHGLIRFAARGTPGLLAERLEEEWLADLATRPSPLSQLRFALGCCWASRVIAREPLFAAVATSPAIGDKFPLSDLDADAGLVPRHWTTVVVVVAIHAAIFYALFTGLGMRFSRPTPVPFHAEILPDPRQPTPPPSLPRPTMAEIRIEARIPEVPRPSDPDDTVVLRTPPTIGIPDPPPADPAHTVSRTQGGPGAGFPDAEDFYPSAERRLAQQGAATLRVCVDPSGRLTAAPVKLQSSGYPGLDEAALRLAQAGSGHYRASTEDGRPMDSCYAFRVRFRLAH